jgi:hypothetical protein
MESTARMNVKDSVIADLKCHDICLEGLKIKMNFTQVCWWPGRDLNRVPTDCKARSITAVHYTESFFQLALIRYA